MAHGRWRLKTAIFVRLSVVVAIAVGAIIATTTYFEYQRAVAAVGAAASRQIVSASVLLEEQLQTIERQVNAMGGVEVSDVPLVRDPISVDARRILRLNGSVFRVVWIDGEKSKFCI